MRTKIEVSTWVSGEHEDDLEQEVKDKFVILEQEEPDEDFILIKIGNESAMIMPGELADAAHRIRSRYNT